MPAGWSSSVVEICRTVTDWHRAAGQALPAWACLESLKGNPLSGLKNTRRFGGERRAKRTQWTAVEAQVNSIWILGTAPAANACPIPPAEVEAVGAGSGAIRCLKGRCVREVGEVASRRFGLRKSVQIDSIQFDSILASSLEALHDVTDVVQAQTVEMIQ